jgi:aryl-alcohol dehydrogenase-like predicted oxidoreductase
MQYRNLAGTDLKASVIGFGCGSILGRVGARKSRRALDVAFESGVDYFDIARYYGFGAAEAFLGKFLQGKRDKICLVSKFGVTPPPRRALIDHLRPLIRPAVKMLRRLSPSADQKLRQKIGEQAARNQFNPESARQSLEQSLRELQTDHLDIWLLHDCPADVAGNDELFEMLDRTVAAGKVRYYGAASELDDVTAVVRARPGVRIAQFPGNPANDSIHRFENPRGMAVNTHTPFGRGTLRPALSAFLTADAASAKRWSAMLDLDLLSPAGLNEFLLRFSLVSNRTGVVICGMYSPQNIRANVVAADRAADSKNVEQVAAELRQRNAFAA